MAHGVPTPMSLLLLAAVAALAALLLTLREVWRVLRALPPPQAAFRRVGDGPPCPTPIPRVLWCYWHAHPLPPFVAQCLANWQRCAPDHTVRCLTRDTIAEWLPALRADFDALPPYRQADWLRIQLLATHGGIWLDASSLLTRDLDWLHATQQRERLAYVGFWIDRYTTQPATPLIENWCMAAAPGCPFTRNLADEFDRALDLGEAGYHATLPRNAAARAAVLQGLPPREQTYLLMHVCAAMLLARNVSRYRLGLWRAEDTAFAFHAGVGWRKRHLFARLAWLPRPSRVPALIKLRSGDRRVVERGLARGRLWRRSLLAELLDGALR